MGEMNKQETAVVVGLFLLLLGWFYVQHVTGKSRLAEREATPGRTLAVPAAPTPATEPPLATPPVAEPDTTAEIKDQGQPPVAVADVRGEGKAVAERPTVAPVVRDEGEVVLSNDHASVTLSPWGGSIIGVQLRDYWHSLADKKSDGKRVLLDFARRPALALSDLPGLTTADRLSVSGGGARATVAGTTATGLAFERQLELRDGYVIEVTDRFSNPGGTSVDLPAYGVALGPMQQMENETHMRGVSYLGLDTLPAESGGDVAYWARSGFMRKSPLIGAFSGRAQDMPVSVTHSVQSAVAWAAAKNKFFVQLLAPESGGADVRLTAVRDPEQRSVSLSAVWADVVIEGAALAPGESVTRHMRYYVGPKKFETLRTLGSHQADVMEFGSFSWLCKPLLLVLNGIHRVIPSYGIAIIILTALVRFILWPVTHKSTESMKKMQKIQPLVNELRARFKDNPQRMNQEVMALYKQHRVNPMAGCLPMLIQIPVFIALFTVLRSAVELRFAPFLWIPDLSEPERLLEFGFALPLLNWDALNILPLLMVATMVWQQKLTPSVGDPQQQKMMMIMPVMMLVFFYTMPSALVLYWTTSQVLSIGQLIGQKRRTERQERLGAQTPAATAVEPRPSVETQRDKNRRRRQSKSR